VQSHMAGDAPQLCVGFPIQSYTCTSPLPLLLLVAFTCFLANKWFFKSADEDSENLLNLIDRSH